MKNNCHLNRTIQEVYDETLKKAVMLRQAGHTLIEKWECEFKKDKATDANLQAFLQDLELVPSSTHETPFMEEELGQSPTIVKCKNQI